MRRLLLAALLFAAAAWPASAAVVYLKDGRSFKGTVVSATARDLSLSTPEGTLRFETDKVSRVDYADDAPAPAAPPAYAPPGPAPGSFPAQAKPHEFAPLRNEAHVGVGFAIPLSNIDFSGAGGGSVGNGQIGPLLGAAYARRLDKKFSLGGAFEYVNRTGGSSFSGIPSGITDVSGHTIALLASARYTILPDAGVKPFVRAGVGAHRTTTRVDGQPQPGFVWSDTSTDEPRTLVRDASWGLAAAAALGVELGFSDASFWTVEAGWMGLERARYEPTQAGRDLGLENASPRIDVVTVALRWGWRF